MTTRDDETDERGDGEEGQRALRADARRNRTRVLEAVWRLLAEKSPDALSMDDVAREADIGKGTLYRHYPNKECLFAAVIGERTERLRAALRERIPPEADAMTKLRALVALVYDAYETYHVGIDPLMNTRLYESLTVDSRVQHPKPVILARLRDILAQGVREGSFRPLDLDYAASAVFALCNPISFAKQREYLDYDRAKLEGLVCDMLWHALRSDTAHKSHTE